ncbi:MAG: shikimate kinase [Thermoprotei archaeon]|jgi:shikimate kinase
MKGESTAFGAISVVNAIPTGIGASAGIKLKVHVKAEIIDENSLKSSIKVNDENIIIDNKLINASFSLLKQEFKIQNGLYLDINSEIPISRGLKSSSAVANAIIDASLKAFGINLRKHDIIKLGIKAAINAGVTITGAFDDACASMFGGIHVTDNRSFKILSSYDIEEMKVVILVPSYHTPKSLIDKDAFKKIGNLMQIPINLALKKQWLDALTLNGLLVSLPLKIDLAPIWDALRSGAKAAGITGTGPGIVSVTDEPKLIIDTWRKYEGKIIVTETRRLEYDDLL